LYFSRKSRTKAIKKITLEWKPLISSIVCYQEMLNSGRLTPETLARNGRVLLTWCWKVICPSSWFRFFSKISYQGHKKDYTRMKALDLLYRLLPRNVKFRKTHTWNLSQKWPRAIFGVGNRSVFSVDFDFSQKCCTKAIKKITLELKPLFFSIV